MQQFNNSVTIISMEEIFCGSSTSEETIQIDGSSYSDNSPFCFQDVNTNEFIHSPNPPDTVKANILPLKVSLCFSFIIFLYLIGFMGNNIHVTIITET